MDAIPYIRFAFSIFVFGLLVATFGPVLELVTGDAMFSSAGESIWGVLLMVFWVYLPLVNVFVQGILLLMHVQKRRYPSWID